MLLFWIVKGEADLESGNVGSVFGMYLPKLFLKVKIFAGYNFKKWVVLKLYVC